MKLKCYLLSVLKIHYPDCQCCAREKYGMEMRKRLEELNWRTQPSQPPTDVHRENVHREDVVPVFDSERDEVVSGKPAA